jgi:arsenate reductase (glutaredoxin)
MTQDEIVIYHNPKCATSRKVLAMLRDAGQEPLVVEYLKTPPTRAALLTLLARLGIGPRALLRHNRSLYAALGLDDPALSDEAVIDAILANPILIERPVVVSAKGAVIARPPERIRAILP